MMRQQRQHLNGAGCQAQRLGAGIQSSRINIQYGHYSARRPLNACIRESIPFRRALLCRQHLCIFESASQSRPPCSATLPCRGAGAGKLSRRPLPCPRPMACAGACPRSLVRGRCPVAGRPAAAALQVFELSNCSSVSTSRPLQHLLRASARSCTASFRISPIFACCSAVRSSHCMQRPIGTPAPRPNPAPLPGTPIPRPGSKTPPPRPIAAPAAALPQATRAVQRSAGDLVILQRAPRARQAHAARAHAHPRPLAGPLPRPRPPRLGVNRHAHHCDHWPPPEASILRVSSFFPFKTVGLICHTYRALHRDSGEKRPAGYR